MKQAEHRMELEKIVVKGDNARANRGQWFAMIIAVVFCGAGTWLVNGGHDAAGGAIATGSVVGLVTVFITGASQRKAERIEKAKLMARQREESSEQSDEDEDVAPRLPGM